MKFFRVFVLLAFCLLTLGLRSIQAQSISVYVLSDNLRASNVETGSVYVGGQSYSYAEQYTSFFANGVGGGATISVAPTGPVSIGLDVRGSTVPGVNGADTFMAGLRVGLNSERTRFKPYGEFAGGYLATRTRNIGTYANNSPVGGTFNNQYGVIEVLGGLDYRLSKHFDFRAFEVGIGTGLDITVGSDARNATIFNINSGLLFHL